MRTYNLRKRILVTGGAGFLGSHLCERLLADGCEVLCADNFFTGTNDNIAHLLPNPLVRSCGAPALVPGVVEALRDLAAAAHWVLQGGSLGRVGRAFSRVERSFSAPENPAMPGAQLDDDLPPAIDNFRKLTA